MPQTIKCYFPLAIVWIVLFGVLVFPFSVAIANAAFGTAIVLSLISGHIAQGIHLLWRHYSKLIVAIALYLTLMVLGLIWSSDVNYGLSVVSHQWLWIFLPVVVAISADHSDRNKLLVSLSIGLAAHLFYCVLQSMGIVSPPNVGGSSMHDATGYIGHIGFGFVYAIWGGWLFHFGWLQHGWKRFLPWLLSSWAFIMIFLAEGRSGYLVATAILLVTFWKHLISGQSTKRVIIVIAAFSLLASTATLTGPGKERIEKTIHGMNAAWSGDLTQVEARWRIWLGAFEAWKEHPILGVGTGGYPNASKHINTLRPELSDGIIYGHPHNLYLQSLARWGIPGLIITLALLFLWLRIGWKVDWTSRHETSLLLISGVAVLIHGLSAASLEEHFPAVTAIIMLGLGLAATQEE